MKKLKRKSVITLILLLLAVTLLALARGTEQFADWYAQYIYPLFVGTLGRFCSLFPVSVVEILLYVSVIALVTALLAALVRMGLRLVRRTKNKPWYMPVLSWLSGVMVFAAALFLLYTCTCGIQYSRRSFSQEAGFAVQPATEEELRQTCLMVIEQINAEVEYIQYDENGSSIISDHSGEEARRAMAALGADYDCMQGYYPQPKGILVSEILSYQQLSGVYSPFTVEANYNADMPDWEIPASMCHELSHLRGFMREDEAGFIAYLACIGSELAEFRYSGAMHAFSYCMNAYYDAAGADAYWELYGMLDERAQQDRRNCNAWWAQFEGPVAEAANSVNDAYLKANNQSDGVKSYGRMADLMIAYWRENSDAAYTK